MEPVVRRVDIRTRRSPRTERATRMASPRGRLSQLMHPDREVRRAAAEWSPLGWRPAARALVYNTLLNDKSIDDRLRTYPTWLSSRNLANEASDDSVQALVDAGAAPLRHPPAVVCAEGCVLGPRLADYDRTASIGRSGEVVGQAKTTVLGVVSPCPELVDAALLRRALDRRSGPRRRGVILRLHGAVASPVPAAQLDRPPARRVDARSRAGPRAARVSGPAAGVFHHDAAHARRDRVGLRRDRHQPTAAGRPRRSH